MQSFFVSFLRNSKKTHLNIIFATIPISVLVFFIVILPTSFSLGRQQKPRYGFGTSQLWKMRTTRHKDDFLLPAPSKDEMIIHGVARGHG